MAPFHHNQVSADRLRLAEMTAVREGRPWTPPDEPMSRLVNAAAYDPGAFRALLATIMCLPLPQEVLTRADIRDTVEQMVTRPRHRSPARTGNASSSSSPDAERHAEPAARPAARTCSRS